MLRALLFPCSSVHALLAGSVEKLFFFFTTSCWLPWQRQYKTRKEEERNKMNFLEILPVEVLLSICLYLNITDLVRLGSTSKFFRVSFSSLDEVINSITENHNR
jgi:hypothetical protein